MHSSLKQLAADCVERSATSLYCMTRRYTLHGLDHLITTTIVLRDNELPRATQIFSYIQWQRQVLQEYLRYSG